MAHELPKLPYGFDALEPHIDARTMEIHHSKHHAGYTNKLNAALDKYPELFEPSIEELMLTSSSGKVPLDTAARDAIRLSDRLPPPPLLPARLLPWFVVLPD